VQRGADAASGVGWPVRLWDRWPSHVILDVMDDDTRAAIARIDRWFELNQAQHQQFRAEMLARFDTLGDELRQDWRAAIRTETNSLRGGLRTEMKAQTTTLRKEFRTAFATLAARLDILESG
jgi:hypothetical protein